MAEGNPHLFNYAIICRIPQSFATRALGANGEPLNMKKAREEYETIREVLKNCDVNLIELQEDENYPDCCFVEDTAIVIAGTALITRPGHSSRQGEVSIFLFRLYYFVLNTTVDNYVYK